MITEDHLGELNDIIERAKQHPGTLNSFEEIFLEDWEVRLALQGHNIVVSDKQSFVFEGIYRKLSQVEAALDGRDDAGDRPGHRETFNLLAAGGGSGFGGQE